MAIGLKEDFKRSDENSQDPLNLNFKILNEMFDFSDPWHDIEFLNGAESTGYASDKYRKYRIGNIWFLWIQVSVTNIAENTAFMKLPDGYISKDVMGITFPVRQNAGQPAVYVKFSDLNGEVTINGSGTNSWTTGRYATINTTLPIAEA